MYKYDLKISIFSKDKKINELVHKIEILENYTYNIKQYSSFDKDAYLNSDLVVIDEEVRDIPYLTMSTNAKIILCTNEYKNEYKDFSSIVIKPIDYNLLMFEINKVLQRISLEDKKQFIETCLNTTINSIPDMFWIKSLDGIHTLLNDKFCEVVDKPKEEVTGKDHYYIWNVSKNDPNNGADICKKTEDEVIKVGHTLNFNESVKCHNGKIQLVTYKTPLLDKFGSVVGTIGIGRDITDFKNLGLEYQILLDSVPTALLIKDTNNFVINVNAFFEKYFGISKKDIIGMNYEEWAKKTFTTRNLINKKGHKEGIFYINEEEKIVELLFENILNTSYDVTGQVCVFNDSTIERKFQSQLIENSNTDFLSGLYNRRYLRDFISQLSDGTFLTLFTIDLDHFKEINDNYGHDKGDEVIRLTSTLLKNYFNTDLIVRMGGDEFLIVKTGPMDLDRLKLLAEGLLDYLLNNFSKDEKLTNLSASIGISQGELFQNNFSFILHKSDAALYQAKESGRSCFVIDEEIFDKPIILQK